jgi:hypothetical protein
VFTIVESEAMPADRDTLSPTDGNRYEELIPIFQGIIQFTGMNSLVIDEEHDPGQ